MAVKARDQVTIAVGVDVASVDNYYKLQSSTATPPTKPTVSNPEGWSTSEPTYDGTSTNTLYICQKTTLTDGTFYWSAVSKSTSYEAAKSAWNLANSASEATGALGQLVGSMSQPYQAVEWIETTGRQFIATEYIPGANGDWGFDADFIYYNGFGSTWGTLTDATETNLARIGLVFGIRQTNSDSYWQPQYAQYMLSGDSKYGANGSLMTGGGKCNAMMYTDGRRQQCSFHNGVYTAPDGSQTEVSQTDFGVPRAGMVIAGLYQNPQASGSCNASSQVRIYSLKFYDDEVLAADFKPCIRISDKVPGLYDSVSNIFYPARGISYGNLLNTYYGENQTISDQVLYNNETLSDQRTENSRLLVVRTNRTKHYEDGDQITIPLQFDTTSQNSTTLEILHNYHTATTNTELWLRVIYADNSIDDYPVYYSIATRLTTHYGTGSVIHLTCVRDLVGNAYKSYIAKGFITDANYYKNDNTYDRRLHNDAILAVSAITKSFIVCGTSSGYRNVSAGAVFDLSYPLLYASAAIAVNKTAKTAYQALPDVPFSTTGTIENAAANSMLYLKGTISGNLFTIASSPFLTCSVPSTEDGYVYIPLGIMVSATAGYFATSKDLYAYLDGEFRQVTPTEIVSTHRIYYRTDTANSSLAAPTTWVAEATGNVYNQWTTKVPPLAASTASGQTKYLYLYTCEQRKRLDGTTVCTKVLLDENTTVIDGGSIITNSITANQIAAGSITATEIDASNLHVSAANIDGTITANQINASGLSIGYSQVTNTPTIPSKVSDLTNDSQFQTASQVDSTITSKGYATTAQAQGYADAAQSAAEKVATNYITHVDSNGITIHPSGISSSKLQVNASGTTVYQNNEDVAFYGATSRIGKANGDRVEIDSTNGITIYKGTKKKIQTTTDGMNIYGSDGSSVVGSFGETVTLGNPNKTHIEIDPYSLSFIDYNDNRNFIVADLRTINGTTANVTDTFWSDGRTVDFPLSYFAKVYGTNTIWSTATYTVLVDDEEVTSGIPANLDGSSTDNSSSGNWDVYKNQDLNDNIPVIKFASSPQDKTVKVVYDTVSNDAKALTFGSRSGYPNNVGGLSVGQGYGVVASGRYSQARGQASVASGRYSQAEGYDCSAEAEGAYARGYQARAKGKHSTAIGKQVYMDGDYGVAIGKYGGMTGSGAHDYAFLVGNGTGWNSRKNAFSIKWDGTVQADGLLVVGNATTGGEKVKVFGAVNLYAKYDQQNSAIGNTPSVNEYHGGMSSFDYSGERDFYSETAHTTADALYRSFVVRRLNGTTAITNGFYIGIDASGNSYVNFTSDGAEAWRDGLGLGSTYQANVSLNSATKAYSSGMTPKYKKWGNVVNVYGAVSPKSEVAAGGTLNIGTLPSGYRPSTNSTWLCQGSGNAVWALSIDTDGSMTASRYRSGASVNAAIPTTAWLIFNVTYIVS